MATVTAKSSYKAIREAEDKGQISEAAASRLRSEKNRRATTGAYFAADDFDAGTLGIDELSLSEIAATLQDLHDPAPPGATPGDERYGGNYASSVAGEDAGWSAPVGSREDGRPSIARQVTEQRARQEADSDPVKREDIPFVRAGEESLAEEPVYKYTTSITPTMSSWPGTPRELSLIHISEPTRPY